MELVFAAIIWSAQTIYYVPMSRHQCEAVWWQSITDGHPRIKAPVIVCVKAKWSCEKGFQLVEPEAPTTN